MSFEPKFMTFEEWKAENSDLIAELQAQEQKCDMCGGTGLHDCECGYVHTCGCCDGTGKVGMDLNEYYEERVRKDKKALEKFKTLLTKA